MSEVGMAGRLHVRSTAANKHLREVLDPGEFTCQRCGHCCTTIFIALEEQFKKDPDETKRLWELHRCDVIAHKTADGTEVPGVAIPLTCINLGFDRDTHKYFCKDYENRPELCKKYRCR